MVWVIKLDSNSIRERSNKRRIYVANAGSQFSYTNLKGARRFRSREEAEGHKCENEFVVEINE